MSSQFFSSLLIGYADVAHKGLLGAVAGYFHNVDGRKATEVKVSGKASPAGVGSYPLVFGLGNG